MTTDHKSFYASEGSHSNPPLHFSTSPRVSLFALFPSDTLSHPSSSHTPVQAVKFYQLLTSTTSAFSIAGTHAFGSCRVHLPSGCCNSWRPCALQPLFKLPMPVRFVALPTFPRGRASALPPFPAHQLSRSTRSHSFPSTLLHFGVQLGVGLRMWCDVISHHNPYDLPQPARHSTCLSGLGTGSVQPSHVSPPPSSSSFPSIFHL